MEKKSFISKYYNVIINVLIIGFIAFIVIALSLMRKSSDAILDTNVKSLSYIQTINNTMRNIDNNVLESVNLILTDANADITEYVQKIDNSREECKSAITAYNDLEISTIERNRYEQFRVKYQTYEKDIDSIVKYIEQRQASEAATVYELELIPVKNCTSELLDALTYLTEISVNSKTENNRISSNLTLVLTVVFGILVLVVINLIKAKIDKDAKVIDSTNKNLSKTKDNLTTAVFKDVLTGSYNRMSFLNDFSDNKEELHNNDVAYMVMFNINNFDDVNIMYGSNAGDIILEETVKRLESIFKDDKVYRTGSDEFVVYAKRNNLMVNYNKLINDINTARYQLTKPYDIQTGQLTVIYSTSMIKKAGPSSVSSRTLEYLKDAMNKGRKQNPSEISFIDLDMQGVI